MSNQGEVTADCIVELRGDPKNLQVWLGTGAREVHVHRDGQVDVLGGYYPSGVRQVVSSLPNGKIVEKATGRELYDTSRGYVSLAVEQGIPIMDAEGFGEANVFPNGPSQVCFSRGTSADGR